MQYLLEKLERVPETCVWEITDACNLRCIHCEGSAGTCRPDELSTEEALELCGQLADLGVRKVDLSGGEPLVRRDWHLLAARLVELGIEVHLITNGLEFDEQAADLCVRTGVTIVSVSIDGLKDTHDSIRQYPPGVSAPSAFRRAYQALVLARSRGLVTAVITHVNGRNLHELERMHELFSLVPIDTWQIQLGSPQGRMLHTEPGYLLPAARLPRVARFVREHQDRPFEIACGDDVGYYTSDEPHLRGRTGDAIPYWVGCYAGVLVVAIESDGGVKGCPSFPTTMVEGNIRQRRLRDIWEDPESFACTRRWDPERLRGYCRRCEYRHVCRAGCTSFAMATTGSMYENRHCLHRIERCGK